MDITRFELKLHELERVVGELTMENRMLRQITDILSGLVWGGGLITGPNPNFQLGLVFGGKVSNFYLQKYSIYYFVFCLTNLVNNIF